MTLWDVFAGTAARFGSRTAVEVQRRDALDRFSYQQLQNLAVRTAAWLHANGIVAGDRCAILADNDAHWCATYLGILRLGAVAVPLDTNYSARQVATILRDCGAKVLFTNERLSVTSSDAVTGAGVPGISITSTQAPGTQAPSTVAPWHPGTVAPDVPAVILYTSGTTSDPKGVVLSHANLIAERDAAFKVVNVTERDSVLGVLPLFHALAQLANLLLPFAVGARVVFIESLNSQELVRALAEREITIFACVPQFFYLIHQRITDQVSRAGSVARTVFRALLALNFRLRRVGVNLGAIFFRRVHKTMGRQMRLFVTGGSKFDPEIGRVFYSMGFTILQAYGLTETSGAATINTPHEAHIDTVGRGLPGVDIKILAPDSNGIDGEVAIRGPIVMQGYFNRPDATAAVMQDGWFLSGDLGRVDGEGRLTITGRKKEVIVLANGKNIYPEEVETHYRQSMFVKELCVTSLAATDHPTSETLYAVVVPDMDVLREKKIVNAGELLRFELEGLSAQLPSYKRVHGYDIWFEALPRTTTGKLKRHEIERKVHARRAEAQAAVDSATLPAEDAAWLERANVGEAMSMIARRAKPGSRMWSGANLELDLGLDSMERVELVTELEQRFGVEVDGAHVHEIFTVRHLVDAVTGGRQAAAGNRQPAADESWAVILRDLPPVTDPVLGALLRRRPVDVCLLFLLSRVVRTALGRVQVTGLEHLPASGPFMICPNHQSYVDPAFLLGVLPFRVFTNLFFVGAVEYFETPLMRRVARMLNLVPVDPDSNLVPAMKAGAFGLAHGRTLVLFPEGERSIDGTVRRFKKGAPILAQHMHVPIVPVALDGVFDIWPRGKGINRRMLLPWSGHRVRVSFGAPMTIADGESYADGAERLKARVVEMMQARG